MKIRLRFILALAATFVISADAQFVPDDIQAGAKGVTYSDPEFHSGTSRVVFQNSSSGVPRVWIGEISPATGAFVSVNGRDLLVDTAIATLGPTAQTNNGPEWGEDSAGVTVTQMTNVGHERDGADGCLIDDDEVFLSSCGGTFGHGAIALGG